MTMSDTPKPLPEDDLEAIASSAAVGWPLFRGARVFLTGGTGFFGRWLVESFVAANERHHLGASLTVLSRDPERFLARAPHVARAREIDFVTGDVRSFAFPSGAFTHVVHAAASSDARLYRERTAQMVDTIFDGTRRVLDFAQACGAKRLLFVSSGAVYGPQPPTLSHLHETFAGEPNPLDATTSYACAKRSAERLCELYRVETVVARAFAFVGPLLPLDQHFAVGNFLADALAGRAVQVAGDGTPLRSYLYASDLATWLWALAARGASGRAYNVGSDRAVSIAELARLVSRLVGTGEVKVAKRAPPRAPAARYVPSVERAKSELGLSGTVSLEDAILRTAAWYREDRPGA